jgi:hypothetical protein
MWPAGAAGAAHRPLALARAVWLHQTARPPAVQAAEGDAGPLMELYDSVARADLGSDSSYDLSEGNLLQAGVGPDAAAFKLAQVVLLASHAAVVAWQPESAADGLPAARPGSSSRSAS